MAGPTAIGGEQNIGVSSSIINDIDSKDYWRDFVDDHIKDIARVVDEYNRAIKTGNEEQILSSQQQLGYHCESAIRMADGMEQFNRIKEILSKKGEAVPVESQVSDSPQTSETVKTVNNASEVKSEDRDEIKKEAEKETVNSYGEWKVISGYGKGELHVFMLGNNNSNELSLSDSEQYTIEGSFKYQNNPNLFVLLRIGEAVNQQYYSVLFDDLVGRLRPAGLDPGQERNWQSLKKEVKSQMNESAKIFNSKDELSAEIFGPENDDSVKPNTIENDTTISEAKAEEGLLTPEFIQENIEKSFAVGGEWVIGEGESDTETLNVDVGGPNGVLDGSVPEELVLSAGQTYKIVKTFGLDGLDPDEVGMADESATDNKVYILPVRKLYDNLRPKWVIGYGDKRKGFIKTQYRDWLDEKFLAVEKKSGKPLNEELVSLTPPVELSKPVEEIKPPEQNVSGDESEEVTIDNIFNERYKNGKLRIENEIVKDIGDDSKEIMDKQIIILEPGTKRKWEGTDGDIILTVKNVKEISAEDGTYEIEFEGYDRPITRTYDQWRKRYYDSMEV